MQLITGITSDPKQTISIPLPDGSSVSFNIEFRPQQKGWFYGMAYSSKTTEFILRGCRLISTPNLLRQYQNIIPFGMAVITSGNIDPTTQTAFSDGTIKFLLIDATDIADIESQIYTGSN